jgi:hypothetical protein
MKCIKAIKASKTIEAGTIQRVDDVEAEARVKSNYWIYISKSEWKSTQPKEESKVVDIKVEQPVLTVSEKQLKRKKQK